MSETMERFNAAMERGDATAALMAAPFGYVSQSTPAGFRFSITSGPRARCVGEGRELIDAIRAAVSESGR